MIDAGPNSASHLARSSICMPHGVSALRPGLQGTPGMRDRSVGSLGAGLPKTGTFDMTHASDATDAEFGRSEGPDSGAGDGGRSPGWRTKEVVGSDRCAHIRSPTPAM